MNAKLYENSVGAEIPAAMSAPVSPNTETKEVSSTPKKPKKWPARLPINLPGELALVTGDKKMAGTEGTQGTASHDAALQSSTAINPEGTGGTLIDLNEAVDPLHEADNQIERLSFDELDMPCFIIQDDWFFLGGKRKPGVWYCYETEGTETKPSVQSALRICSPLYVEAVSNTESGQFYGRLLKFRDTLGRWRNWCMPMELLRGSCEELRGELLAAGLEIEQRNRSRLAEYLQWRIPKKVITAATRTGWTAKGNAFVFHDRIIGADDVYFQSEAIGAEGVACTGGSLEAWRALSQFCRGNPVLMVSVCVALAGPLLAKIHRDSGGVHWLGDSSIGKTTALIIAASVWGGADFKRTWRATSNGLEGAAANLSDTCLCLDEISEANPKEVAAIIYSLGNGTGKTRATRIGSARHVHRWRLTIMSTGERSIPAILQETRKQAMAGLLVRLLNIPAKGHYGVFDDLHHFADGRAMADYLKTECAKHYGHAGMRFVEHLITLGDLDFGAVLAKIEQNFKANDSQAARAASRFALYAMAGELGIEAGILPWEIGTALTACLEMYQRWLTWRGSGMTEDQQILRNLSDYLLKHGDTRFTEKGKEEIPKLERAGWFINAPEGRIYLLTPETLSEAGGNYDQTRILDALDAAGWIAERDQNKRSKKTHITGLRKINLYWIRPTEDYGHA